MDVGVSVKVGARVGVPDGSGVNVKVGDGEAVGVSVEVGVAVGKTSAGLARTRPVIRSDMTTRATVSPIKMYLMSESMGASIRREARGVKECEALVSPLKYLWKNQSSDNFISISRLIFSAPVANIVT